MTPAALASVARDEVTRLRQLEADVTAAVDRVAALGVRRAINELEAIVDLLEETP